MKQMLKLGLTLAIFASVACVGLALINNLTSPVISEHKQAELRAGLSQVFADADSFDEVIEYQKPTGTINVDAAYYAKKGGEVSGVVIKVTGPTYDKATILVGLSTAGQITGIQFLSLTDTPGFGQRANDPEWYNQFVGKNVNDAFVLGSDVDAVSGATITSKGVVEIIRTAIQTAAGIPVTIGQ